MKRINKFSRQGIRPYSAIVIPSRLDKPIQNGD